MRKALFDFTGKNIITKKTETKKLAYSYNALNAEEILTVDKEPCELHKKKKTDPDTIPEYSILGPQNIWKLSESQYESLKDIFKKIKAKERMKMKNDEYYNIRIDFDWMEET